MKWGENRRPRRQTEYWRWRYRDAKTGMICRTPYQMTAEQAAEYSEAVRIPGTMSLRAVDDDFADTTPWFFAVGQAPRPRG